LAPVAAVVVEAEVLVSEVVEAEVVAVVEGLVLARVVVAPASVNTLVRRKAKRLRKNQRESLYPHLAGGRYCGLPIPIYFHL
jgi:hypothetical protein